MEGDNQKLDAAFGLMPNVNDAGYNEAEDRWRVIVKYYGDLSSILSSIRGAVYTGLFNNYAVVSVPATELSALADTQGIVYVEKPREVYYNVNNGRAASCINSVQNASIPGSIYTDRTGLNGAGVLVAIIDSGIDYLHPGFRNSDGTTRILYLWDQGADAAASYGRVPAGYAQGAEYDSDDINEALAQPDRAASLKIVPVSDRGSGHGTAVAGVAAGNGAASPGNRYKGVAPESSFIVVKLGKKGSSFALTTEIMEAIDYTVRKSITLNMPIAINLSFGNNDGPHDGNSLFENYIADIKGIWKNVVVVAAGNEGDARHHAFLKLENGRKQQTAAAIAENERNVLLQIWKHYQDVFNISITAPDGSRITLNYQAGKAETYIAGNSRIYVFYGEPSPYTISQGIFIQWLPVPGAQYIMPGVWYINFDPVDIKYGIVNMWLPTIEVAGLSTGFLSPSPDTTLTIPAAARNVITVGAYNATTNSMASFSGRGNTTDGRYMPTIVAPGVDIMSAAPGGGYSSNTGTSIAAPFVTGSAALMMEWGYGVIIKLLRENRNGIAYGIMCTEEYLVHKYPDKDMLNELDKYLKSDMLEDYWYDNVLFICEDIIQKFSFTEWSRLKDIIPKNNIRWNIRLIECLGDINNQYSVECILKMLNIDNDDVFIACIDALRDMDMSLLNKEIIKELKRKAELLLKESILPVEKILKKFIENTNV